MREGKEEGGKGKCKKEEGNGRGKTKKYIMSCNCNLSMQAHTFELRITADYSYLIPHDPSSFGWSECSV